MQRIDLNIPEAEFERLNKKFPPTEKSSNVGERAIELTKFYFKSIDELCSFREKVENCDLEITTKGCVKRIEVKGTASREIAWDKLKVSGQPSHDALLNGMPLYRVIGVYERNPVILVLLHQQDFEMVPEPRWRIKSK